MKFNTTDGINVMRKDTRRSTAEVTVVPSDPYMLEGGQRQGIPCGKTPGADQSTAIH